MTHQIVHIVGHDGCGKTFLINELLKLVPEDKSELFSFKEHNLGIMFLNLYKEGDPIIMVDTNPILCYHRVSAKRSTRPDFNVKRIKERDVLLKYMTSLPNCTIINNDLTEADFKVKIKKYFKANLIQE